LRDQSRKAVSRISYCGQSTIGTGKATIKGVRKPYRMGKIGLHWKEEQFRHLDTT